jgi:ATP-dependent DNA helicase RecQ
VFTDFTRINENEIARRSGIDSPKIMELLKRMQRIGIIDYLPHKNSPQLIFNTERLNPDDIALSKTFYSQRKKEAFSMLESIISYATTETKCRSRMLVSYFGEIKSENCGVCDVCLNRRRKEINAKKSIEIEKRIFEILSLSQFSITNLVWRMNTYKENDVLTILRCLIEDGRVQQEGEILSQL